MKELVSLETGKSYLDGGGRVVEIEKAVTAGIYVSKDGRFYSPWGLCESPDRIFDLREEVGDGLREVLEAAEQSAIEAACESLKEDGENPLEVKVGFTYLDGQGDYIPIVRGDETKSGFRFFSASGCQYDKWGMCVEDDRTLDLVMEVPKNVEVVDMREVPEPSLRVRVGGVGGSYRRRAGDCVRIVGEIDDARQFVCEMGHLYSKANR